MKSIFVLGLLSLSAVSVLAQTRDKDVITTLEKVSQKLNQLSGVHYRYNREMKYHADNYHNKDSATMYIDFKSGLPIGLRFQAKKTDAFFIYDGKMTIRLDNKNMTIDSTIILQVKQLESNSFLFNSLASLRNNLPVVIANDSIRKELSDTLVDGRNLISIRMEGRGMYLNPLKGINYFDEPGLRRPYFLLIDKQTLLPYQFIAKIVNGTDDRDFIKVTYLDIQQNPVSPASDSWSYANYQNKYKPYVEPRKVAVVKPGAPIPFFNYPVFNPMKSDSLSLTDLKGKVVLLEFWFKSCGPCIKAMPHYNDLQQKFGKNNFELVTINIEDGIEDIEFFYKKYPPSYKMLYNGLGLFEALGFNGCPSSLLVDRNGKAARTFFGFDQEAIEKSISELLKVQ